MLAPDRIIYMGLIEQNSVIILIWIVWNRTIFDIETVRKQNLIIWIRTVRSKLCSSVSGWLGVFASIAMSSA